MGDNAWTSPSDLFQQLLANWEKQPPGPALIIRLDGEMPSVALRSLAITQIDCFVVPGCASGHNLVQVVLGTT